MSGGPRKRATDGGEPRTAPPVGQGDMTSIPKIDLDLHGDAIGHRQDEPQPKARPDAGAKSDRKA